MGPRSTHTVFILALAVGVAACVAACASGDKKSSSGSRGAHASASARVVEVTKLPPEHQEVLRAYGAGGETWEAMRARVEADPQLTRFLVENLFLELVRAHRSLGGRDSERALRARNRARVELAKFGASAAPTLAAALEVADDVTAELASETLGAIGRPALPAVTALLSSKQASTRQRAAYALARMSHGAREEPEIRAALVKAGRDREWFVRAQAARALGARGSRDVETEPWRTALQALLLDEDEAVVEAAATGLVELADPLAIGVLIDVLARNTDEGEARKFKALQSALLRLSGEKAKPSIQAWRAWWRDNRARFERRG
jgi:HEAT repeat protein